MRAPDRFRSGGRLKRALKADIDEDAWASIYSTVSRPLPRPETGKIAVKGFPAWLMHRYYHGLAIPMWERKIRVFTNWILNFFLRRDIVSIEARETPREAFAEYAARPK